MDIFSSSVEREQGVSLPIKITLIVYWCLAITGFLIAVFVMNHLEQDIEQQFSHQFESAYTRVQNMVTYDTDMQTEKLQQELNAIRSSLDIAALELRIADVAAIQSGDILPEYNTRQKIIDLYDASGQNRLIEMSIYHPSLESILYQKRRNFLLAMGGFFILFGGVLAVILRKIIALPFSKMVFVADKISNGCQDCRFNEEHNDEFGFLARFFNRTIEQLISQRDELTEAFGKLKKSEASLSQEKESIQITLDSIVDAVITTDNNGKIQYMNPAAEKLLCMNLARSKECHIDMVMQLIDENSKDPIRNPLLVCLDDPSEKQVKNKSRHAIVEASQTAVTYNVAPLNYDNSETAGAVMVLHDVEQTRQLSKQLSYQASHDSLTGLYNRRAFEKHLRIALDTAAMGNSYHALLYMDLDQFKVVNDSCGHVAGDELLRQLGELMRSRLRNADIVARLGGDEFGILLQHCDPIEAEKIAVDIKKLVKDHRFRWEGRTFEYSCSIGLVAITSDSLSIDKVLGDADMACYVAKENGRNKIHVYQPDDDELNQRRGEILWMPRIKDALTNDRLTLHYQTISNVDDNNTDEIHFEVLMRMFDENDDLIPPMAFIPAAERFNLMPEIDRWVIQNTFRYLRTHIHSSCNYTCSINLSGQSLSDEKFLDFVIETLDKEQIAPENICFEITETAAITNLNKATLLIDRLKKKGCKFSLDDFGSGLSSFSYLRDLHVDYLKIDGSFIKDMVDNPIDYSMVEAINRIGHVMKLKTIAEFVENDEILKQLRLLGINYAQGFGIAKPAPLEKLLDEIKQKGYLVLASSNKEVISKKNS